MTTGKALNGKPYAGNPHVRFDEGEVALAATPRRGSLLYNLYVLAASVATAAAAHGFEATLADPLAWLYPDSKVASAERIGEIDVPSNGVIDVNLLLNGLKPGERLVLESSEKGGEWCRMVAVPVSHNTGNRGFLDGTLSVITDTDADFGLRVSYNLCYNVRVLEAGRWSIEKFILEKCVHL